MPRFLKSYLDNDEFKAKKVFTMLEAKQKKFYKGPAGYKRAIKKTAYFLSGDQYKKNTQVIVKISGNDSNLEKLKDHLRYISRAGELEIYTCDDEIIDYKTASKYFNITEPLPSKKDIEKYDIKEKRETLHIVFSMKDYSNAGCEQLRLAASETLRQKYPNNYFVIAMHNDTAHPHCHIVLKVKDDLGKRINPNPNDLNEIRELFASKLREQGIEATNKSKAKSYIKEHKEHYYKIISYGKANYKFDDKNELSFYVRYQTNKGKEVDIWAKDLERVVAENNLQIGEYARLAITGEEAYQKTIYHKKTKTSYKKTIYKKTWDISVEGRAEKILNPLKKYSQPKYEIVHNFTEQINENKPTKELKITQTKLKTQEKPVKRKDIER